MANPQNLTGGSRKGIPNKTTAAIKDMIVKALDDAGGVEYLVTQAKLNPAAFMALVGKVLPMQVSGDPDNPVRAEITVRFLRPNA
jgi:hypothetical protein